MIDDETAGMMQAAANIQGYGSYTRNKEVEQLLTDRAESRQRERVLERALYIATGNTEYMPDYKRTKGNCIAGARAELAAEAAAENQDKTPD